MGKINKYLDALSIGVSHRTFGGRIYLLADIKQTGAKARKEAKSYRDKEGCLARVTSTGERPFSSCRNGKPGYAIWVARRR